MKDLTTYPISFPFGATSPPYSPSDPHHGEDRKCPTGTLIVVNGTELGEVGSTGFSSGPHCHIDKSKKLWDYSAVFVDPKGWSSITGQVIDAGDRGTAGLTVVIQADNGYFYRFLHMSKITAKEGQKVGVTMVTITGLNVIYRFLLGSAPTEYALKNYLGKVTFEKAYENVKNSDTYKAKVQKLKTTKEVDLSQLPSEMRAVL